MQAPLTLNDIYPGEIAVIKDIVAKGNMRKRLQDIGIIKGTAVQCVGKSPMGDPCAYLVRGAVVAIRSEDCSNILIFDCVRG